MATTPHEYFMGRRNAATLRVLETNGDISTFIRALLEHIADFASQNGIDVKDVKIDSPFITDDGYLRGRILK